MLINVQIIQAIISKKYGSYRHICVACVQESSIYINRQEVK